MLAAVVLHLICLKQSTDVIRKIIDSGRCVTLAESPDSHVKPFVRIAPGQPPILTFRYYEGKMHHRYGNSDLMLDDAGH